MTNSENPFRIGLTGGIASGKSAVADCFAGFGVPVIDTDVIAREVVQPGMPALEEIRETLDYGVIKMNIDTDAQYAFTRPVVSHICSNIEGVLKIDGEVGNKKTYDPRSYLKKAEESMAARLAKAAEDLCSNGKTIFGTA